MSSLALICYNWGKVISGSDKHQSTITENLKNLGIQIYNEHKAQNIADDTDLVVYTSAISHNNSELKSAKKKCKYVLERADFLYYVSKRYKNVIAISGTHGKTTTCGMLTSIFKCANLKPTVHVGGIINNFDTNCIIGDNNYFITEACEYKKHFLRLKPTVGAVLNVEEDHMECYQNYKELNKCFVKFLKKSKIKVSNTKHKIKNHINYAEEYKPVKIELQENGCYEFTLPNKSNIKLSIFGKHNINNALCAIAVSKLFNVSNQHIQQGLLEFKGVQRRFEFVGKKLNARIIRDYAHHPSEIKTTINTLQQLGLPFIVIFQPHTYSRTQKLLNGFCECLSELEKVYIYKTYAARENKSQGISAKQLSEKIHNADYIGTLPKLKRVVNKYIDKNINIVFVGAGDIGDIAKQILI